MTPPEAAPNWRVRLRAGRRAQGGIAPSECPVSDVALTTAYTASATGGSPPEVHSYAPISSRRITTAFADAAYISPSASLSEPLLPAATPDALPLKRRSVGGSADASVSYGAAKALIYGLINSVVCVPVMIAFAAIIFRNPRFHSDPAVYASLVKLVLASSVVHQAAFTGFSSLPFAIGQVQDAGLIFLSRMADTIVHQLEARDASDAEIYANALVLLALTTAALGVALIITGKLHLAQFVQYLPLPVVGGYLAFIGLYCLQAGLSLMSDLHLTGLIGPHAFAEWSELFSESEKLVQVLAGVLGGVTIVLLLQRVQHPLVLPATLVALPLLFYAYFCLGAGNSLDDLRRLGWVAAQPPEPVGGVLSAWRLFDFSLVDWSLLPSLFPTWLAMYVVVAFSSSLDVAAIQMDMGKQLDFNHELITVGLSNLFSGLGGGFTGSYIFSQTILTFRVGVRSRLCGLVIIAVEAAFVLMPFSPVAFVPKLFFGAVLTFIAIELMADWLVRSRGRVHRAEYGTIWVTFFAICWLGLELGMAAGVLMAMSLFIYDYARVPVAQRVRLRSNVMRPAHHSAVLADQMRRVITLRCNGYIFFGSTMTISKEVLSQVVWSDDEDKGDKLSTLFVIFDFANVSGLDASAARSCFLNLCRTLSPHGISVLFGGVAQGGHIEKLLIGHQILEQPQSQPPGAHCASCFDTVDEALEFCEEALLADASASGRNGSLSPPLRTLLPAASPELPQPIAGLSPKGLGRHADERLPRGLFAKVLSPLLMPAGGAALLDGLRPFFGVETFEDGQQIFGKGQVADTIYFVATGEVTLWEEHRGSEHRGSSRRRRRLQKYSGVSGVFGELDFFLRSPRSFHAEAASYVLVITLRREALAAMEAQEASLATALEHALLRMLCVQINNKLGISEGTDELTWRGDYVNDSNRYE